MRLGVAAPGGPLGGPGSSFRVAGWIGLGVVAGEPACLAFDTGAASPKSA